MAKTRSGSFLLMFAVAGPTLLLARVSSEGASQFPGVDGRASMFERFKDLHISIIPRRTFAVAPFPSHEPLSPVLATRSRRFELDVRPVDLTTTLSAIGARLGHVAKSWAAPLQRLPPELTSHILEFFHRSASAEEARSSRLVQRQWNDTHHQRLFWRNQWFRIGPSVATWHQLADSLNRMWLVGARNVRIDVRLTQLEAGRGQVPENVRVLVLLNDQVRELDLGRFNNFAAQFVTELLHVCQAELQHLSVRLEDMVLWSSIVPILLDGTRMPNLRTLTVRLDSARNAAKFQAATYVRLFEFVAVVLAQRGRLNVIFRYGDELRGDQSVWIDNLVHVVWPTDISGVSWFLEGRSDLGNPLVAFLCRHNRIQLLTLPNKMRLVSPPTKVRRSLWALSNQIATAGLALLIMVSPPSMPVAAFRNALYPHRIM
ncbi:hypothetical protein ACQY0O_006805 [Thecaphora frezii]